jgi:hypothetical protein
MAAGVVAGGGLPGARWVGAFTKYSYRSSGACKKLRMMAISHFYDHVLPFSPKFIIFFRRTGEPILEYRLDLFIMFLVFSSFYMLTARWVFASF